MKEQHTDTGIVVEALPNLQYRIELSSGVIVRAYVSGKMKIHRIRLSIGDRVEFVIDSQGSNNRIIKRLK